MRDQIISNSTGLHYFLNGREVTQADYEEYYPPRQLDLKGGPCSLVGSDSAWPVKSEGAAVHPDQRQEAIESAAKRGVPTYFDRVGRPEFTSLGHQRRYLKAYGLHNNDDNA